MFLFKNNDNVEPTIDTSGLRVGNIGAKSITYSTTTEFAIQVGRNIKASYKTKLIVTGDLDKAVQEFNSCKISSGMKKRLVVPSSNNSVLLRTVS